MRKLVVFDVDGTLLDSGAMFIRAIEEYSEGSGLPRPCMTAIAAGWSAPEEHDFKWGLPRAEQALHLNAVYRRVDRGVLAREPAYSPALFPGAREMLEGLRERGHTLALVTGNPEAVLRATLEPQGVDGLFAARRTFDDTRRGSGAPKPAPDHLLCVMRELGFAAQDAVMVGDTDIDIRMGVAAGTTAVGVTWGVHGREVLSAAGAHHVVETGCAAIPAVVDKVFG